MKKNKPLWSKFFLVNIFALFLLWTIPAFAIASVEITGNDSATKTKILEERFIIINGIEQWVTIKGDISKPIVLFIHGGPGSPISPYSDNLYQEW